MALAQHGTQLHYPIKAQDTQTDSRGMLNVSAISDLFHAIRCIVCLTGEGWPRDSPKQPLKAFVLIFREHYCYC